MGQAGWCRCCTVLFALLLAACTRVDADDIVHVSSYLSNNPEPPRHNVLYDSQGNLADSYRPNRFDTLVLRFSDRVGNRAITMVEVNSVDADEPRTGSGYAPVPATGVHIMRTIPALRVPLGVLNEPTTITTGAGERGFELNISFGSSECTLPWLPQSLFGYPGSQPAAWSWGEVKAQFHALPTDGECGRVDVELEPSDITPASFGDTVVLTRRLFQTDAGSTSLRQEFSQYCDTLQQALGAVPRLDQATTDTLAEQAGLLARECADIQSEAAILAARTIRRQIGESFELPVDHAGTIEIPSAFRLSQVQLNPGGPAADPSAAAFGLEAGLMTANTRLRIADMGLPLIAECLSRATAWIYARDPAMESACGDVNTRFGLEFGQGTNGDGTRDIVYSLTHGPRSWTLSNVTGERVELPYRYGVSVADAVRQAYRASFGHDAIRNSRSFRYVVVFPGDANRNAFGGRLRPENAKVVEVIESVMLMPGDAVHVTIARPAYSSE